MKSWLEEMVIEMEPIDIAFQLLKMLKQGLKMTPEELAYYQDLQNRAAMLGETFTPDMGLSDEERKLMRETMPENPLPTQNRPTIAVGRHPNSRGE